MSSLPQHKARVREKRGGQEWADRIAELREFFVRHGHTRVSARRLTNPALAKWCDEQREHIWRLPPERVHELLDAGFHLPPKMRGWFARYFELVDFQTEHGHCNVPKEWPVNRLGRWVCKQRQSKSLSFALERRRWLNRLGFVWNTKWAARRAAFEAHFQELTAYHQARGHCNVSMWDRQRRQLAVWVDNLRARPHKFTREQKRRLNQLGFEWHPAESRWRENLRRLREFQRQHGHCRVPQNHSDRRLARWVVTLRGIKSRQDKRSAQPPRKNPYLTEARLRELERLGFDWNPLKNRWEVRFAELCNFKKRFGHCEVPKNHPDDRKLVNWVCELRAHPERQSGEHRRRLEGIGFHWKPDRSFWNRRIKELETFHATHGHSRVTAGWNASPHLANWVASQRRNHYKLSVEQFRQLDRLGVFRRNDPFSPRLRAARSP